LGLSQARLIAGVGFLGWEQSAPSSPPAKKFGEALKLPSGVWGAPPEEVGFGGFGTTKITNFALSLGVTVFGHGGLKS